jgi:Secretion system C-terminal sorting domain
LINKLFNIFLIILFLGSKAFPQNIVWESTINLPNFQFPRDSEIRGDSKLIFTATNVGTSHFGEVWLVDTFGNFLWQKKLQIPGLITTAPNSISKFPDTEEFLIVGTGNDSTGANMTFFSKIDSAGNTVYSKLINYPSFQGGADGLILPDGTFLVLGGRFTLDSDVFVVRADSTDIMWEKTFFNNGVESARQFLDLFNGRILISSVSDGHGFFFEVDINGNFYDQRYLDTGSFSIQHIYISNSPNGGVYQSALLDTGNNDFLGKFYEFIDSTILWESKRDPIENNFVTNIDSNQVFVRYDGMKTGVSLFSDSTSLWDLYFPVDGITRTINKIRILNSGNALLLGTSLSFGNLNVWTSKISGIGNEWVQDPCIISPPQIGFSWDYQFPSLTLTDTSFSGLQYLDTIYNRQWLSSSGDTSSQEQFTTFWDTTGNTTLDITLIIENWYGCRDTLTTTLSYWINGMEPPPTPSWNAKLYPNPARSQMILNLEGKDLSEKQGFGIIYDIHGRAQEVLKVKKGDQKINLSQFPPGLYILKIDINQESKYLRFVKGE